MSYYDAAMSYAARTWCIIPIRQDAEDKVPAVRWKPYQTALPTEVRLLHWFTRCRFKTEVIGLAVICGPVSGGLVVRDFDTMEAYDRWAAAHPDLAATLPTVKTKRGRHIYFRADVTKIMAFTDGELKGGGYVCLPPTLHPSGITYQWLIPLPHGPLPVVPDVVAAGMIGPPKPKKPKAERLRKPVQGDSVTSCHHPKGVGGGNYAARLLAQGLEKAHAGGNGNGEGARNESAVWLACQLRDNRIPRDEAKATMREYAMGVPRGSHEYTGDAAMATLESIYSTPARDRSSPRGPWHNNLPQWILDLPLRPYQRVLLQTIADRCDGKPIDVHGSLGYCIAGSEDLAKLSGMRKRTAQRHVKAMLASGLIVLVNRGGWDENGECCANGYAIPGVVGVLDAMRVTSMKATRFDLKQPLPDCPVDRVTE